MSFLIKFILLFAVLGLVLCELDRCTTITVGAKAGLFGPMTTHTADCSDCDFRISKVPARDWPEGSMRPLYVYRENYPATISAVRGTTWLPSNLEGTPDQLSAWGDESVITGYVPQVSHTFALYEAGYGIMNEHQVAIGESTCASRFWAPPTIAGGKAAIDVRQMSQIGLERAQTAREAIQIMGDLAVEYGFYGADWSGGDMSLGEGGEALTVIDKTESWVFHVLGDDTGTSAIWAAQRVPDNHISAVANQFVMRGVDPASQDFMFSSNLWDVATRNGLWSQEDGLLDFKHVYGRTRGHPPYATRRVWRVYNLAAPSLNISADTDEWGDSLPFSVPVDESLKPEDLMRFQRDHYEGTPYDLTKGLAAGPYGDPARFDPAAQLADGLTLQQINEGGFERAISLFRTSYSFVAVARQAIPDLLSLVWFTQYAPHSSSYIPLYVQALDLPRPYTRGSLFKYDDSIPFWNFLAVGNYAARFYKYAMADVFETQSKLQLDSIQAVEKFEASLLADSDYMSYHVHALTEFCNGQAYSMIEAWKKLLPTIITKYHDGYRAENLTSPDINMVKLFYPAFWLDNVGFFNTHKNSDPNSLLFDSLPTSGAMGAFFMFALSTAVAFGAGMIFQRKLHAKRSQYTPIYDSNL